MRQRVWALWGLWYCSAMSWGVPWVRVPVLSKMMCLIWVSLSRVWLSLMRMPWRWALFRAAVRVLGVASERAQGQVATRMASAISKARLGSMVCQMR
nr:hypothetical protein [Rappaport israeli]